MRHQVKGFVLAATWVAVAGCGGRDAALSGPTPVVLISLDTLRADRLNCYGYRERTVSPRIDALARDAILFEDHIAASPWTVPSHISLLTSLWPSNHGVTASLREIKRGGGEFPVLSESRTTLAEILSRHGYATAAFTAGTTLDPVFGFGQGFSVYRTNMMKLHAGPMEEMGRWVAEHRAGPFFLFWHTFEPHVPYLGTRFLGEVLPPGRAEAVREAVERYAERARQGKDTHPQHLKAILAAQDAFELPVLEALYVGSVADTDRWVGRFLDGLRELGLYDPALVILTSDHGEEFGDHSPDTFYDAHGHSLWREMVRVPLIVKLPGQERAGTRVRATSRAVDVMPTVLDVVRLPGSPQMQGMTLRPLWEQESPESRTAFAESLESEGEQKAIRSDRYKYVVEIGAESVLRRGRLFIPPAPRWRGLYDLESDEGESTHLLEGRVRPEHDEEAERLDRALREHVAAQGPDSRPEEIDAETLERLRQLGYIE